MHMPSIILYRAFSTSQTPESNGHLHVLNFIYIFSLDIKLLPEYASQSKITSAAQSITHCNFDGFNEF